jgi:photosystem II stability/assembly factor-like uncharacterized protein
MLWKVAFTSLFFFSIIASAYRDDVITYKKPMLSSVRFIDDSHGWIAGCRGVFYTSDGGQTWQKQSVTICLDSKFTLHPGLIAWNDRDESMIWTDEGLVVGNTNSALWRKIITSTPLLSEHLQLVAFADKEHGWGTGVYQEPSWKMAAIGIHRTNDSGKTWTATKNLGLTRIGGLLVISRDEVWAVGRGTAVMHTKDGGKTWEQQNLYQGMSPYGSTADLSFIHFVNQTEGWVGGTDAFVFHTSDGGKTWQKQETPFSRNTILTSASFVDEKEGWVVGSRYINGKYQAVILYTKDAGLHWESQLSEIYYDNLISVQALSNGQSWVIGSNGTVLHTVNHGQNWNLVKIN